LHCPRWLWIATQHLLVHMQRMYIYGTLRCKELGS